MRCPPRPTVALLLGALLAPPAAGFPNDAALRGIARLLPEERPADERVPAYLDELDKARLDLASGRYRRVIWNDAARGDDLLVAEALLALGHHPAAADRVAEPTTAHAAVLAGRIAADAGRRDEAVAYFRQATRLDPSHLGARRHLGQALEAAGDTDGAIAAYRWFADEDFAARFARSPDDPVFTADALVHVATALDRLATLTLRYREEPDLHDELLAMLVRAFDVVDRGHVEARVAAGKFAARRGDREAAAEDLGAALARRPTDADALVALGGMHLDRFGFDAIADVVSRLRRVDPASREASLLEAEALLLQRQPDRALPLIDRLLAARPDDKAALGLLAAASEMRLDFDAARAAVARVEAIDPDDADVHFAVGKQLAVTRQYARAADALRRAIERAPWMTQARNKLADVYVQSGQERRAIAELILARELDPFDARTLNYLTLLEEMGTYARQATTHFVVRHDPDDVPADGVVADLMAKELDAIHEAIAEVYDWAPDEPTQIQVFPTHDRFSVRVAGDPYVGTVGACTGPVIALVAPRDDGETLGAFDWHRVLRHEYIHTITLGATDNRIWHWLTEGLAVRGEDAPISQGQLNLLASAVNNDHLFGLEELTWGFVRPERPTDRSQAYAQSWMVVEYLVEQRGEGVVAELIDACRRGLTEREAADELLGQTPSQFDADFEVWMRAKVAEWGHDSVTTARFAQAMQRGESAIASRDWPAAVEAFEEAAELRPLDEGPARRLAALYTLLSRPADAAERFDFLAVRTTTDGRFAARAARLWLDLEEPDRALASARLAVLANSYDPATHALLADALELAGRPADADAARERSDRLRALN